MKKFILGAITLLSLHTGFAQEILNDAIKRSSKEHKLILINFSGSDWCIPCIKMQHAIFENNEFIRMADTQLVIIRADFPRKKKNMPPKEVVQQNEMLAEKYNREGNFPLTVLTDASGKVIRIWDGLPAEPVADFLRNILQIIQQFKQQKNAP